MSVRVINLRGEFLAVYSVMYEVIFYQTARGDVPVKEFIDKLITNHQAKIYAALKRLQEEGPNLRRPEVAHLRGKILELRVRFATNQYRILFFFSEDTIVLLHAFLKKTQQVPAREIERAERNMDDFLSRAGGK